MTTTLNLNSLLPSRESLTRSSSRQVILLLALLCYHLLLQIDFACPCSSEGNFLHCYSYMVLPSLIITSLIMWNDERLGRIFRFVCYHSPAKGGLPCRRKFCLEFVLYVLQAAASAFLWCGSVLVDGDWYVCCGTGEELRTLSCRTDAEMSPADRTRWVNLKNQSMVMGLVCILLTALWSLVLVFPWNNWCTRRNHFRAAFEEAVLQQTELIVWTEMDKAAAKSVTKALDSLSPSKTTETTMTTKTTETTETTETTAPSAPEEIRLNIDVDWEGIARLADVLIESIPKHFSNHNNINVSIKNNINGN